MQIHSREEGTHMSMDKKTISTEEYRMIDTLSQMYLFCYVIDLDTMRYQRMDDDGALRRRVDDSGHHEDEREWFLTHIVDETYQAKMRRFTKISTVAERLKGKLRIYEDYLNYKGKWVRAAYLPATYDEADGHLTHVLFLGQELEQPDMDSGAVSDSQDPVHEQLFKENKQLQKDNEQIQVQLETVMSGIRGGYMICRETEEFPFTYVSPAAAHV